MTKPQEINAKLQINRNQSCALFWYIQGTVFKDRFLEARRKERTLQVCVLLCPTTWALDFGRQQVLGLIKNGVHCCLLLPTRQLNNHNWTVRIPQSGLYSEQRASYSVHVCIVELENSVVEADHCRMITFKGKKFQVPRDLKGHKDTPYISIINLHKNPMRQILLLSPLQVKEARSSKSDPALGVRTGIQLQTPLTQFCVLSWPGCLLLKSTQSSTASKV